MKKSGGFIVCTLFLAAALGGACTDITDSSTAVLSIQFDSLPVAAVVVDDTLRDTTGAIIHPVVRAFNFKGAEITPAPVWFQSPDSGITVDSATGIVFGDSVRASPARIIATVGSLQAIQRVDVTLRPDLIQAVNAVDSLKYSVLDSVSVSPELQVRLVHGTAPNDSAVKSYIVSFEIVYQPARNPGELINGVNKPSIIDTTDASGIAGRKIRLHSVLLDSPTAVDSIVVNATAKYLGAPVSGSPVRLVLHYKPTS